MGWSEMAPDHHAGQTTAAAHLLRVPQQSQSSRHRHLAPHPAGEQLLVRLDRCPLSSLAYASVCITPYVLMIIAQVQRCSMVNVGNNGSVCPLVPHRPHTGNKHQCSSERQRLEWISSRTNSSSLGSRSYSFANSSSCESSSCCQTSRSTDISS